MSQRYQLSGSAPIFGVSLMFLFGLITAAIGAVIYSYAMHWIPIVQLNFVLTALFGMAIGGVVAWRATAGHVRSRLVPAITGLLCGIAGVYLAWGTCLLARAGVEDVRDIQLAFSPDVLLGYIGHVYEHGAWRLKNHADPVTGVPLAILWVIEFITVLAGSTLIPWHAVADKTYCEDCRQWCETESDLARLPVENQESIAEDVNAGDLRALYELPRLPEAASEFLRVNIIHCPACSETNYLTLNRVAMSLDDKGEVKVDSTTLADRIVISRSDADRLRELPAYGPPVAAPVAEREPASETDSPADDVEAT